jgi:hypothetical protein
MGLISKAELLAAKDLKTIDILVSEWGGDVRLTELSGAALTNYWESCRDDKGTVNRAVLQANLLQASIVDEAGVPMFTPDDVATLMAKNATALQTLFKAAQELNGMMMGAPAKNSESAPNVA